MSEFVVTEAAQRPARKDGRCFYCERPIGEPHASDCVLIRKKVKVRAIVEYEISVPAHWDRKQLNAHRNDSTWCADNMIKEMLRLKRDTGCLCAFTRFDCFNPHGEPFLCEQ